MLIAYTIAAIDLDFGDQLYFSSILVSLGWKREKMRIEYMLNCSIRSEMKNVFFSVNMYKVT